MNKSTTQQTPKGLCDEARRLWLDVQHNFELGPDGLEILRVACWSLHRFLEAKQTLDREGLVFETSGGMKRKHPCVEIAKNERAGFLAATRLLNLDFDDKIPRKPGRPAGGAPWS